MSDESVNEAAARELAQAADHWADTETGPDDIPGRYIAQWSCGRRWNRRDGEGPDVRFVQRLRSQGLSDEIIALVLRQIDDHCLDCFDADADCQCENDE